MQRRTFVGSTIPTIFAGAVAQSVLLEACANSVVAPDTPANAALSLIVTRQEGRTAAPLNVVGETALEKVRGTDSGGLLCLFDFVAPPMSGPPLHKHSREDELFFVLEGELVVQLDGVRRTLGAGATVYSPRGVVHAYQNFTTSNARLLIAATPGGFGVMFEEMSAATPAGGMPSMDVLETLHHKYGITTMGPPLQA